MSNLALKPMGVGEEMMNIIILISIMGIRVFIQKVQTVPIISS